MNADTSVLVKNYREFDDILKTNDRVVALFYASWCPFCTRFLPVFKKSSDQEKRLCVIVQDDREAMADRYAVKIYPTVLFFEKGVLSKRLDGVSGMGLDEKQLMEFMTLCRLSSS